MSLFAFGSNGSGQLGLGHTEDIAVPERCHFDGDESRTELIAKERVFRIAAGGNHALVLFRNGSVYAKGCNIDGRCGISEVESVLRFKRICPVKDGEKMLHWFKNVSTTWESSFLVTGYSSGLTDDDDNDSDNVKYDDDGDMIFALGSGTKGELGLGTAQIQATTPTRISNFPPRGTQVVSIASGMGHTAVVLSTGEVYGWGGARKGQLGEPAKASKVAWSPVKIEGVPFHATDIACGREFTVVSGDKEKGEYAVLGSCDDKWNILSGRPVSLPGYTGISAGWHGIYVHRKDACDDDFSLSVTAWGRNDRGQLPPADLPNPRALAVGSEHALALLDERALVAFGWGEHGNCGAETDAQGNVRGRFNKIQIPSEVGGENPVIVGVGAGCATSWIITS